MSSLPGDSPRHASRASGEGSPQNFFVPKLTTCQSRLSLVGSQASRRGLTALPAGVPDMPESTLVLPGIPLAGNRRPPLPREQSADCVTD